MQCVYSDAHEARDMWFKCKQTKYDCRIPESVHNDLN